MRSEPGRGSTLQVHLPPATRGAPAAAPMPATVTNAGGTVLLVEDDDLVRSVTAAMLKEIGFSVLAVAGGAEAVTELGRRPPGVRLILCNLSMPGMNGWETLAALHATAPGIPAILCSGYDRAQAMAGHHRVLPQGFLRKPYRQEELSEAIRRVLGTAARPR